MHPIGEIARRLGGAVRRPWARWQARRREAREARDTIRRLELFAVRLAHDFRGPLATIRTCVGVIELEHDKELSPELREKLGWISGSASSLDELARELLAYSRARDGELRFEPVDLDAVLEGVVASLPDALRRGWIRVEAPLGAVVGHAVALHEVFDNLLGNALKYVAPETEPEVRVWSEAAEGRRRVWVADNGIGIAPADQPRIFDLYARVHSRADYPGTGIGLASVREAVSRMGGRVGVDSVPGHGSRFWVELPAACRDETVPRRETHPAPV